MEAEKNPFEAVRTMMLENLEKIGGVTQNYIDMVERTMRSFPGANQEQIIVNTPHPARKRTARCVEARGDFVGERLRL